MLSLRHSDFWLCYAHLERRRCKAQDAAKVPREKKEVSPDIKMTESLQKKRWELLTCLGFCRFYHLSTFSRRCYRLSSLNYDRQRSALVNKVLEGLCLKRSPLDKLFVGCWRVNMEVVKVAHSLYSLPQGYTQCFSPLWRGENCLASEGGSQWKTTFMVHWPTNLWKVMAVT